MIKLLFFLGLFQMWPEKIAIVNENKFIGNNFFVFEKNSSVFKISGRGLKNFFLPNAKLISASEDFFIVFHNFKYILYNSDGKIITELPIPFETENIKVITYNKKLFAFIERQSLIENYGWRGRQKSILILEGIKNKWHTWAQIPVAGKLKQILPSFYGFIVLCEPDLGEYDAAGLKDDLWNLFLIGWSGKIINHYSFPKDISDLLIIGGKSYLYLYFSKWYKGEVGFYIWDIDIWETKEKLKVLDLEKEPNEAVALNISGEDKIIILTVSLKYYFLNDNFFLINKDQLNLNTLKLNENQEIKGIEIKSLFSKKLTKKNKENIFIFGKIHIGYKNKPSLPWINPGLYFLIVLNDEGKKLFFKILNEKESIYPSTKLKSLVKCYENNCYLCSIN